LNDDVIAELQNRNLHTSTQPRSSEYTPDAQTRPRGSRTSLKSKR
jgi:hypothetical protein